jgi:hypothetical protein
MANVFDQFDAPASQPKAERVPNPYNGKTYVYVDETASVPPVAPAQSAANPFDQFDEPKKTEHGTLKNVALGALKGASNIGATILAPVDFVLNKTGLSDMTNEQRREALKQFFNENANTDSLAFKGGELSAEIAGTAGIGGAIANGVRATGVAVPALAKYVPRLATAIESGGFSLGSAPAATTAGKVGNALTRLIGGTVSGGATAGMVDPQDTGSGALLGAAMPAAVKAAGFAGNKLVKEVSPEVAALYQKAKALGIDIPVDRIANSKPLNALASSLNYLPFSGRAATEEKMFSQLNRATSRTFGQDSDNITAALRKAGADLGAKFDQTLSSNAVKVDNQFLNDLTTHAATADSELGAEGAQIIKKQINEIINKGANGQIDGQAAYNIKKTLDRIGNRNAPEAYYARELKKSLMGALNRSLGPQDAAEFAKVRQQYGNMLELENLAQNGAEGGISVGRLANLKNINNPDLQSIADIAAQFVKTREAPHGAAQRVTLGALAGPTALATGTVPLMAGGMAAGRLANTVMNSETAKNLLLNRIAASNKLAQIGSNPLARALGVTTISTSP